MNTQLTSRAIAAATFGILGGLWIHSDLAKWQSLGRDAFLSHQALRFDKQIAHLHPAIFGIIGTVILSGVFFGLYELIVFAISKLVGTATAKNEISGRPFS